MTFIKNAFIAAALAVAMSATAPAAAQTPLEKYLKAHGNRLPHVIDYGDFINTALEDGMVEIEEALAEKGVSVHGTGDSRYIRTADLLQVCGSDCNYRHGWGIFLSRFSVQTHRK